MVKKTLIVVFIIGILLALNASAFSGGNQQDRNNAPPVDHTQLDPATRGHAWQEDPMEPVNLSNNELCSESGPEDSDVFSSFADFAFKLYYDYFFNQQP